MGGSTLKYNVAAMVYPKLVLLAFDLLFGRLEKEGYYEAATSPGLWKHEWRPIQFCLIVNDFGIEYVGIEHFNHLLAVLQGYHQVQTNKAGNKIAGLNVQWDFPSKRVHIDMKYYFIDLLLSLNWRMPKKPLLLPFTAMLIAYGQKNQYTPDKDTSSPLSPECIKCIQKIIKSLLYYAQAVDNKLLVALNAISARQAKATVHMEQLIETLLNYVPTYPNYGIVYRANMTLRACKCRISQQNLILHQSGCTYLPLGRQSITTLQPRGPYNSNHCHVCHGLGC